MEEYPAAGKQGNAANQQLSTAESRRSNSAKRTPKPKIQMRNYLTKMSAKILFTS